MNKTTHLDSVIKTHQISKEESLLSKHKEKNAEVKEALQKNYGEKIYSPFNSGSYAKNTAMNLKFDFDMVAPFKRNAFGSNGTLKEMYEDVYNFLYEKYKDVAEVRKQKVSIGIEFHADDDGDIVKIDVVPGRELNQDKYDETEDLNLYVYNKYGTIEAGSERIKTNVKAQINNIKDRAEKEKDSIRKIIRLLKVWKNTKLSSPAKSFFLELITIKAFDNKDISGNLWDKLETVLEYIRDEVTKDAFTLKDPGNSNNDLIDTLTSFDRQNLSDDMKLILDRIEDNDENIKTYFPENQKFVEEEEDDNKYDNKGSGFYSSPPKTERFG
jgi:hypothetical protein